MSSEERRTQLGEDLIFAAERGDKGNVEQCLEQGANINYQNWNGSTALHEAAWNGRTEIVRLLIDRGIDINLPNNDGSTALHKAAWSGQTEIVRLLIDHGININLQNEEGDTALHIASRQSKRQTVKCLLDKECDPHILNKKGEKPIDVVSGYQDILKLLKEYGNTLLPGLPTEVKKFDKKSAQVFSSLLKEESYPHFESRLMLAGEQGTGKTTLARYLVGKRPTRFRISTDGIELYNGLSYMDRESKDWLGGLQDFSLEEILVSRSLLKEEKITKQNKLDDTTPTSQDIPVDTQILSLPESSRNLRLESKDTLISDTTREWSEYDDFRQTSYSSNDEDRINDKPIDDSDGSEARSSLTGEMHIHTVTKPGVVRKLKNMFGVSKQVKEVKVSISKEKFLEMSSKVGKKQLHNKKIAPIIIWDFGGQDVFYSTHQTFLTYRAIYMVVLDGSRTLDDPCPYEKYLPGKGQHKTARDYLLFWINTIVTYCKGSNQGFPKIMVVLTHKDQVKAHDVEERRHEIFAEIYKMFQQTPFEQHLVIEDQIFVNAQDENDTEMEKIKKIIMSESERQPTWGELLPKCFIPLELEIASLIRRNITLITLEHLKKINALQPIRPLSEDELKVFLKFQHSIGKLLYFDEPKLDDRIILSPTLLIDAFKSIVTDKQFCKGDKKREEMWDAMGTKWRGFKIRNRRRLEEKEICKIQHRQRLSVNCYDPSGHIGRTKEIRY
ncbi:unnamed protein product [Mytilus edulis]|uniref:Non-specific serine/threonine protein kinase n=1 Tax=Mytilus edulis TaxID=6550 RepID=A0A8S3V6V0_MYTED|nr:unnamed protein product [Mytilus edulis]